MDELEAEIQRQSLEIEENERRRQISWQNMTDASTRNRTAFVAELQRLGVPPEAIYSKGNVEERIDWGYRIRSYGSTWLPVANLDGRGIKAHSRHYNGSGGLVFERWDDMMVGLDTSEVATEVLRYREDLH